jgi:hypothetical protein
MNRRPVQSSNVASVGYEPGNEDEGREPVLEVEFKSGGVYRYTGVSEYEYRALLGASSIGKYVRQSIIGNYEEERV